MMNIRGENISQCLKWYYYSTGNSLFQTPGQGSVELQLAVALFRFGRDGNGCEFKVRNFRRLCSFVHGSCYQSSDWDAQRPYSNAGWRRKKQNCKKLLFQRISELHWVHRWDSYSILWQTIGLPWGLLLKKAQIWNAAAGFSGRE